MEYVAKQNALPSINYYAAETPVVSPILHQLKFTSLHHFYANLLATFEPLLFQVVQSRNLKALLKRKLDH